MTTRLLRAPAGRLVAQAAQLDLPLVRPELPAAVPVAAVQRAPVAAGEPRPRAAREPQPKVAQEARPTVARPRAAMLLLFQMLVCRTSRSCSTPQVNSRST